MKAELMPLEGKYYGTIVKVTLDDGETTEIKIWHSGDYTPSERECQCAGISREQWLKNEMIDEGSDGLVEAREILEICDSHFESQVSYWLAERIVKGINGT